MTPMVQRCYTFVCHYHDELNRCKGPSIRLGSEQSPLPICKSMIVDPEKLASVKKNIWVFPTNDALKIAKVESLKGKTHLEAFEKAIRMGFVSEDADYSPPTFEEVFDL